jgi:hypothetical protein
MPRLAIREAPYVPSPVSDYADEPVLAPLVARWQLAAARRTPEQLAHSVVELDGIHFGKPLNEAIGSIRPV